MFSEIHSPPSNESSVSLTVLINYKRNSGFLYFPLSLSHTHPHTCTRTHTLGSQSMLMRCVRWGMFWKWAERFTSPACSRQEQYIGHSEEWNVSFMACWKHVSWKTHLQHGISHFLTHAYTHSHACSSGTHWPNNVHKDDPDAQITCILKNTFKGLHACPIFQQSTAILHKQAQQNTSRTQSSIRRICGTTCFLPLSSSFTHSFLLCIPPGALLTPRTTDPTYFIQKEIRVYSYCMSTHSHKAAKRGINEERD